MSERKPRVESDSKQIAKPPAPNDLCATVSHAQAPVQTWATNVPAAIPRDANDGSLLSKNFGRYRIERELGHGGMGVVYLAEDTQLGRKVALKLPHPTSLANPEVLERFYREARTCATLRHPNICPVFDVGSIDGRHYLTMAYIPGKPVSSFLGKEKLPAARPVALLIRKIAQALDEAHKHGIVHRDLKPSNVMLDDRYEPIVMDFGLARMTNTSENARLTQSGALLGTPAYMSPEQVEGETSRIGPASDIYSLGVMLYQFLTGRLPFEGPISLVLAQILRDQPKPPSFVRPEVDRTLEAICLKMMAKEIDQRFDSMKSVATALTEYLRAGAAAESAAVNSTALAETVSYLPTSAEPPSWMAQLPENDAPLLPHQLRNRLHTHQTWTTWLRQHRSPVAITGVAVLLLTSAVLGTGVYVRNRPSPVSKRSAGAATTSERNRPPAPASVGFEAFDPVGEPELGSMVSIPTDPPAATGGLADLPPKSQESIDAPVDALTAMSQSGQAAIESPVMRVEPDPRRPENKSVIAPVVPEFDVVYGVSSESLAKWFEVMKNRGFRPNFISMQTGPSDVRFNAIAVKNETSAPFIYAVDLDARSAKELWDQYQKPDAAGKQHRQMIQLFYAKNGEPRQLHIYEELPAARNWGAWSMNDFLSTKAKWEQSRLEGLRPTSFSGPTGSGLVNFTLNLVDDKLVRWNVLPEISQPDLSERLKASTRQGWRPDLVYTYYNGIDVQFLAILVEDLKTIDWELHQSLSASGLKSQLQKRRQKKYWPASIVSYEGSPAVNFSVLWLRHREPSSP